MTLSMDRIPEYFDFSEFNSNGSYNDDIRDSQLLIHESSEEKKLVNNFDTDSKIYLFDSCGSGTAASEDKTMLDMDQHKHNSLEQSQSTPPNFINEVDCNEFPFADVLSFDLDFTNQGSPASNSESPHSARMSPLNYPNQETSQTPVPRQTDFAFNITQEMNEVLDCSPLTPEKIAMASVDFKKLSYEKLNRQDSQTSNSSYYNFAEANVDSGSNSQKGAISKQPLPPEGFKITRYPMKTNSPSSTASVDIDQNTAFILRLQRELKSAKQAVAKYQRSMEDWKNTAHYALQTAKRIKARYEAATKNHFMASSSSGFKETWSPGIFSPKIPVQTTSLSFQDQNMLADKRNNFMKRSVSEPETSTQCKMQRMNPVASRDVASLIKSKKYETIHENIASLNSNSRKSAKGALSNNVKLALRAKVCRSKQESGNDVFDIYKEVKDLLLDLPPPAHSQSQSQEGNNRMFYGERQRVSSSDDIFYQRKTSLSRKESLSDSSINKIQ